MGVWGWGGGEGRGRGGEGEKEKGREGEGEEEREGGRFLEEGSVEGVLTGPYTPPTLRVQVSGSFRSSGSEPGGWRAENEALGAGALLPPIYDAKNTPRVDKIQMAILYYQTTVLYEQMTVLLTVQMTVLNDQMTVSLTVQMTVLQI